MELSQYISYLRYDVIKSIITTFQKISRMKGDMLAEEVLASLKRQETKQMKEYMCSMCINAGVCVCMCEYGSVCVCMHVQMYAHMCVYVHVYVVACNV